MTKRKRRKITIDFVRDEFLKRGYILCEDEYVNAKHKMKYICKNHPFEQLEINWSDFNSGRGCRNCANDRLRKARQKDINDVKKLFDEKGLVLVSSDYVNNRTNLDFYCKIHNKEIQQASEYMVSKAKVSVCKYCIGEYHSERQLGEKSHRWKGGVREKNQALRETLEYKRWRESVFKRDNYTCQKCKSYGVNLHAHHIYPFSEYEDLRHVVDNGITLCADCHDSRVSGSFHNIYGTRNNTLEQLEEFLGCKIDRIADLADKM